MPKFDTQGLDDALSLAHSTTLAASLSIRPNPTLVLKGLDTLARLYAVRANLNRPDDDFNFEPLRRMFESIGIVGATEEQPRFDETISHHD